MATRARTSKQARAGTRPRRAISRAARGLTLAAIALVLGVGTAAADSYTDPAGDANGGPDITAVTTSVDAAGLIMLNVTVPLGPGTRMDVGVDPGVVCTQPVCALGSWWTDGNGKEILIRNLGGSVSALAGAIDASGATARLSAGFAPSLTVTATATTVELRFAKAELGIDGGFCFVIATAASVDQVRWSDAAPDSRAFQGDTMYCYTLTPSSTPLPPPTTTTPTPTSAPTRELTVVYAPVIGKPVLVPTQAIAGKRLTVSFPVTRSDDHKPLAKSKMACRPSIATTPIPHSESFKNGVARLSFVVPKTAEGKRLSVRLTITAPSYQGKDGTYVDIASGRNGTTHVWYRGRSSTKIATFRVQ